MCGWVVRLPLSRRKQLQTPMLLFLSFNAALVGARLWARYDRCNSVTRNNSTLDEWLVTLVMLLL
jgi:hypothetical protein